MYIRPNTEYDIREPEDDVEIEADDDSTDEEVNLIINTYKKCFKSLNNKCIWIGLHLMITFLDE